MKEPLPRLLVDDSDFFQFLVKLLRIQANLLGYLGACLRVHTLQVVVVVADFRCCFLDFLCLNLDGDLLLFGLSFKLL